jgi:ubiquinone/menaquinone biosynthesis C-methylase UbiE
MPKVISQRLSAIIDALPLKKGMRVLEIGCGPGVVAREIVNRIENIYVLAIDRSDKAIETAKRFAKPEIEKGRLQFVRSAIEDFKLPESEALFDIAIAIRVGVLDGRHPHHQRMALTNIFKSLKATGRLFIDGGDPLKEIDIKSRLAEGFG